jgi:hypothetical protein
LLRGGRVREKRKACVQAPLAALRRWRGVNAERQNGAVGQAVGQHRSRAFLLRATSRAHVLHRAAGHRQPLFGAGKRLQTNEAQTGGGSFREISATCWALLPAHLGRRLAACSKCCITSMLRVLEG